MKVSLNWLKDFVEIDLSAKDLAELITKSGVEVGEVKDLKEGLSGLLIAEVLSCNAHPDSDHLHICEVTTDGKNRTQVVCGASNVALGQKVVFATVGASLPGGIKIKEAKLRGVASFGMLCGMSELGIDESLLHEADKKGIKVLPSDAPLGEDALSYLGLDDSIIELELTPNRNDCLSIYGVALEVGALLGKEVKPLEVSVGAIEKSADFITLKGLFEDASDFYSASALTEVKIERSPLWLEARLQSAGIRPISNVVDITNYVMLELGQPLHAFDYDKLPKKEIEVRLAREGERLVTLDNETRTLDKEMIVISSGDEAVALAGVMGGASTEVDESTTTVLLEAALFNGTRVRKAAQKLALRSESSIRNEKGLPENNTILSSFRAIELLKTYAGAKMDTPLVYMGEESTEKREVLFKPERIGEVLGIALSKAEVLEFLERLHFECEDKGEQCLAKIPFRRLDVSIEEDLIEEVARLYGYDNIPTKLPKLKASLGGLNKAQRFIGKIKTSLAELGLYEVVTFGFYHANHHDKLRFEDEDKRRDVIAIKNPLSEDLAVMRTTLLGNLLALVESNRNKQAEDIALFEVGSVFLKDEVFDENHLANEEKHLGLVLSGRKKAHWLTGEHSYDYYDVKGVLESLFERLGLLELRYEALKRNPSFHPGQSAAVYKDEVLLGVFGAVHPEVLANYGLKQNVFAAELNVALMQKALQGRKSFREASKYPITTRDMAILVDEGVSFSAVKSAILAAKVKYLISTDFFDVYRDEKLGEGKKSFAFALRFQSEEGTLTDEVVDEAFNEILEKIEEMTGGKLRLQ